MATTSKFAFDGSQIYADLNSTGSVQTLYVTGMSDGSGQLYARIQSGTLYWIVQDRQGSVREIINSSGSSILDAITYTDDGSIQSQTGSNYLGNYGYTGLRYDSLTTYWVAVNRWYDPATDQWLEVDPDGYAGGLSDLRDYVGNDWTNATDLSGFDEISVFLTHCPRLANVTPDWGVGVTLVIGLDGKPDLKTASVKLSGINADEVEVISSNSLSAKIKGAPLKLVDIAGTKKFLIEIPTEQELKAAVTTKELEVESSDGKTYKLTGYSLSVPVKITRVTNNATVSLVNKVIQYNGVKQGQSITANINIKIAVDQKNKGTWIYPSVDIGQNYGFKKPLFFSWMTGKMNYPQDLELPLKLGPLGLLNTKLFGTMQRLPLGGDLPLAPGIGFSWTRN